MESMLKFLLPPIVLMAIFVVAFFAYLPFKRWVVYSLNLSPESNKFCCQVSDILKATGQFDENANQAIFNDQIIDYPKTSLAQSFQSDLENNVLGASTEANTSSSSKWIEVSLSEQRLRAWDGNKLLMEIPISSGRWGPTPTGTFTIWYKTRSQRMIGGDASLGTFYDLPNVPYNMFFYEGYAIHGAYWHNNFGEPMSHGCVNTPIVDAAWLYDWTGPKLAPGQLVVRATPQNPGTKVVIHN